MAVFSRLADLALRKRDFVRAEAVAKESLLVAARAGEPAGIGIARANLALSIIEQQRLDEARALATECVLQFVEVGDQEMTAVTLELPPAPRVDAEAQAAPLLGFAAGPREPLGT